MPSLEKAAPKKAVLQITPKRTLLRYDSETAARLQRDFSKKHCVLLPKFLTDDILDEIQTKFKVCVIIVKVTKGWRRNFV